MWLGGGRGVGEGVGALAGAEKQQQFFYTYVN